MSKLNVDIDQSQRFITLCIHTNRKLHFYIVLSINVVLCNFLSLFYFINNNSSFSIQNVLKYSRSKKIITRRSVYKTCNQTSDRYCIYRLTKNSKQSSTKHIETSVPHRIKSFSPTNIHFPRCQRNK